jgi:hypothetical protein
VSKSTHHAIRQDGDVMIQEAARRLNRSYTWVYYRLVDPKIEPHTYRYKGVIFIRAPGLQLLQDMNAHAPRRGRPRKTPSVA